MEDYSTGLDGGHFGWAIRRKIKARISVPGEALSQVHSAKHSPLTFRLTIYDARRTLIE